MRIKLRQSLIAYPEVDDSASTYYTSPLLGMRREGLLSRLSGGQQQQQQRQPGRL